MPYRAAKSGGPLDEQWIQLKVSIPRSWDDLLRARAQRHGTSIAEEARRLMQLGLTQGMTWEQLEATLDHIEQLVYDAATHGRLIAKVEENKALVNFRKTQKDAQNPENSQKFHHYWAQLRKDASTELTVYLRNRRKKNKTDTQGRQR